MKNYILLVCLFTIVLYNIIGSLYTPKAFIITKDIIDKDLKERINSIDINNNDNLYDIKLNNNNEIIYIDYNMYNINQLKKEVLNTLNNIEDKKLIYIPLGMLSNIVLKNNLGPKIPLLVRYLNKSYIEILIEPLEYGINNALINIYFNIHMSYNLLVPLKEEEYTFEYKYLVSSKIVEGRIPDYYNPRTK